MKKLFHDILNDLAVAMGLVEAFVDEKLEPTSERYAEILKALAHADAAIAELRVEDRSAGIPRTDSLLSAIVEGSPYAKVLVDGNGRITLVNAEAEKLFGYERAEMLGRSVEMLVPTRFRGEHPDLRHTYNQEPEARPMGAGRDLYGRHKDGGEFPIEIGLNPIETDAGAFTLAAISDITERKRAEEFRLLHAGIQAHATELEQLNRELANASRFKTQFIATMSHELRTPLSAIIGATELLAKAQLPDRELSNVAAINESAEALFALIGSILDFSKIEAGKMDLHLKPIEIGTIVDSAVGVIAQLVTGKDIALHAYVDPSIPGVIGDGDRLRQILLNLLGNAAKFTDHGGIVVRALPVHSESDNAVRLRFEVQDTGIGVAPQFVPSLFEPFAQAAHSTGEGTGGSGLGLSISKRLVELMNGEIGVTSQPDLGSLFWFTAVFETIDQPTTSQGPVIERSVTLVHATGETRPSLEARPVLVAEDDARLQRLLAQQFEELGQPVTFVSDGAAAVDAIRANDFAMVFMDCQMPKLDGIAATQAIRRLEQATSDHVAIVAMTANAFSEDRNACLAAGMDDYLAKPVRLADLRACLKRWTKRGTPSDVRVP